MTHPSSSARPRGSGLLWGFAGVLAFSFTVPFTRIAVASFPALFVGSVRAVVAALLAITVLSIMRQRLPRLAQWLRLAVVAFGIVFGFPVFTSLALETTTASEAAVVIGLLPAATAVASAIRARERPPARFWVFTVLGAAAVVAFTGLQGEALFSEGVHVGHLHLFAAVLAAAVGYAEGGMLARELGAWQTVSWALVLALPFMAPLAALSSAGITGPPSIDGVLALLYLSAVSMFLGFFAWYRGLAIGPMTTVSQTQLVQPVLSLLWAATILGETLTPVLLGSGLVVIACAWGAVRSRSAR